MLSDKQTGMVQFLHLFGKHCYGRRKKFVE
jgi:hypothetical protein